MANIGMVQITSDHPKRLELIGKTLSKNVEQVDSFVLVGPHTPGFSDVAYKCRDKGGYRIYRGWEKDKSRKFREGFCSLMAGDASCEWITFLDDDLLFDEGWRKEMDKFLEDKGPGQYGFRLTDENGKRHQFGEDWMQFPNRKLQLPHRPLDYNVGTGEVEDSPTAYVANCVVHREVVDMIQPFGIFGAAPDVMWSMAIRECGFPIGFNVNARAFHLGDRKDFRK